MVNFSTRFLYSEVIDEDEFHLRLCQYLGLMAAKLAHEIRNPLTAIYGFLKLLNMENSAICCSEYFDIIIHELDQINSALGAFLCLARDREVEFRKVDLNQIIRKIAPRIEGEAAVKGQQVCWKLTGIPDLMLNRDEISQLVLNLARNGLDAMPAGGILEVHTLTRKGQVVLSVRDYGPGIPADVLKRLGTPFYTTKESGLGLGLVICQSVAEKHHAVIEVVSGEEGTTLTVCFNA